MKSLIGIPLMVATPALNKKLLKSRSAFTAGNKTPLAAALINVRPRRGVQNRNPNREPFRVLGRAQAVTMAQGPCYMM